jgi:hypothetical protein
MVKKGALLHVPAKLFGKEYAQEEYKAAWQTAKERFTVLRKHGTLAGIWVCSNNSYSLEEENLTAQQCAKYVVDAWPPSDEDASEEDDDEGLQEEEGDDDEEYEDDEEPAKKKAKKTKKKAAAAG